MNFHFFYNTIGIYEWNFKKREKKWEFRINQSLRTISIFRFLSIRLHRTGFWEEYLDLRGMRWRENGGSCTMRSFIICTHPQISLGKSSQGEWGGRDMWHAWERREKCTRFWWERPKERDHWEDQGVGGIRMDFREIGLGAVDWIQLSQDRDRWRAVVSAVMNLRVLAPRS
jgi:hypothetical protein